MDSNDHSPARVGADNDPGVAAAPLGTDEEAAGVRPKAGGAGMPEPARNVPDNRGGPPLTVIAICVLIVGVALILFIILGRLA